MVKRLDVRIIDMPCMCGATDCPSCGPAQGYDIVRVRTRDGRLTWRNPEDLDDGEEVLEDDPRCDEPEPDINEEADWYAELNRGYAKDRI